MAPTLYDEKPKLGDLIEIFLDFCQHWAVYVGEGFIVHLVPLSEVPGAGANSTMSKKAMVKKEELWDVVGTSSWKINNGLDKKYKPRDPCIIVSEACALVGSELPYCVFSRNCEHFANELRYGKAESQQVRNTVMVAGVAAVVGLGIVALAGTLLGGSKNKKKKNKNRKTQ